LRSAFIILALGTGALIVQGALGTLLPPPWCPDLALLVVVGIGLRWISFTAGLGLAALLGLAADLLSGALMGQHTLLRLFAFSSASLASRQLNLRGSLPLFLFVVLLSLAYGFALFLVSSFFAGGAPLDLSWAIDLSIHAVVNAICAPAALSGLTRACDWAGAEGLTSGSLEIDARRRPA